MKIAENLDQLFAWQREHSSHRPWVLVPTMGALHEGHLSLVDRARKEAGPQGKVIASIFVNPTQFGPNEDFDAYPRQLQSDLDGCQEHGVDLVFTPEASIMYLNDASIEISESTLSLDLCGGSRPGHFNGVCTVVAKLFNLSRADKAVFGQKDFQQLAVIQRMVRDLNFPVEIIGATTVREPDGLAMSSRNAYLSPEQRQQAPIIYQSICTIRDGILQGSYLSAQHALESLGNQIATSSLAKIDYLQLVDPDSLQPLDKIDADTPFRIIIAVFFGKTRLIDNIGPC